MMLSLHVKISADSTKSQQISLNFIKMTKKSSPQCGNTIRLLYVTFTSELSALGLQKFQCPPCLAAVLLTVICSVLSLCSIKVNIVSRDIITGHLLIPDYYYFPHFLIKTMKPRT